MNDLRSKLDTAIRNMNKEILMLERNVPCAQINRLNDRLDELRRIKDAVEAEYVPNYVDATAIADQCAKQPYFQAHTSEGLKPVFACVAEDGSRAIVIALDALTKWSVDSRPNAEVFETLIWLKGEKE